MPLGLVSSEQLDDYWSQNTRRKVFYSYPNGTAPLMALLSLADAEDTPLPQFGWNEERWKDIRTTTIAGPTANTVFYLAGTTTTAGATFTPTAGTQYRIYLTDVSLLQEDDVIRIYNLPLSATKTEVGFRVISTNTTGTDYVEAECIASAPAAVTNNAASVVGLQVVLSGTAFAEGSRSRSGRFTFPSEIMNFTQIHKDSFELTGTALKEPLKYDKSGQYKSEIKKTGIRHLTGIERTLFWGDRRTSAPVDVETGSTVRRSYSGGLLWFLKQWELGSIANGGAFDYRENATNVLTQTDYRTYTDKRIIRLQGAAVSKSDFNFIEGLAFRKTNNTEFCKVCFCGMSYLDKINEFFEKQVQVTQLRGEQYKGWDFEINFRNTARGKVYYKNHPLFNDTEMDNSAFYVDMGHIFYRPLTDRDSDVIPRVQLPDADKRKDMWLTEAGVEIRYPESMLFVDNLGGITL